MQYRKRAKKTCKEIKGKKILLSKVFFLSSILKFMHTLSSTVTTATRRVLGWWLFVIQYNYVILYHKELYEDWFIYLWHRIVYFLSWRVLKNPSSPPVCVRNRLGYYSTRHTKNIPSQSFIYIYEPRKTWPARRDTHSTLTHTVYRLIDKDPAPCVLLFLFFEKIPDPFTHTNTYTHTEEKFFFQTILPRNDEFLYNKNCVALSPEEEEEETRAEITRDWPSGRLRHDCDRSRCLQQRALSWSYAHALTRHQIAPSAPTTAW